MDEFIQSALEIARAQAAVRAMTEDELAAYVQNVAKKLRDVAEGSFRTSCEMPDISPDEAKKSLKEKSVTCLICGKTMKVLTKRHLAKHGVTAEEYKAHFGFKKGTPLAAKSLVRMRKEKMESMRLWERRKTKNTEE